MNMNPARAVSNLTRHTLALGLTSLLFVHPALALIEPMSEVPGKAVANLPEAPYPESEGLTIEILEGEGALNNIRQRTAREPIVQVEDKNHKPVAGAAILFSINTGSGGAGGSVSGLTTLTVRTGPDGKAQMHGLKPNNISGEFTITVTASIGTLIATAIIHQRNDTVGGESDTSTSQPAQTPVSTPTKIIAHHHNFLVKGTIIGGAVVTGIVVAVVVTRKTGGATITAGNGTVTAP